MGWKSIAAQLVGFPLAWVGFIYFQQDSLIYHPSAYVQPLDEKALLPNLEMRELPFSTQDGKQSAIILKKPGKRVRRAYFVFGGNAMFARDWLEILPAAFTRTWEDVAFVMVDYPGYGSSEGSPSQASIGRASSGALEATIGALPSLGGYDEDDPVQFGALGHSIGCAAAMQLAAAQQDGANPLHHLMLSAPFASLAEEAGAALPVLKPIPLWIIRLLSSRNAWDNKEATTQLSKAARRPAVDILHGKRDSMVPYTQGQDLFEHIKAVGLKSSFGSAHSGHNDLLSTRRYEEWLQKKIARGAGKG